MAEIFHVIDLPNQGDDRCCGMNATADITHGKCNACGKEMACLCTDGSEGEYEEVRLCYSCIGHAFVDYSKKAQPLPRRV